MRKIVVATILASTFLAATADSEPRLYWAVYSVRSPGLAYWTGKTDADGNSELRGVQNGMGRREWAPCTYLKQTDIPPMLTDRENLHNLPAPVAPAGQHPPTRQVKQAPRSLPDVW